MRKLLIVGLLLGLSGCAGDPNLTGITDVLTGPLTGQVLTFAMCPTEFRVVQVINGKTELSCATTPISNITCPPGQVLIGIKVTDPTGDRKVEPVCQLPFVDTVVE